MRHKTTIDTFAYWNSLRADRDAPHQTELLPTAMPGLLPHIFILEQDGEGGARFRLAGTEVCSYFCRELKGESFRNLWSADFDYAPVEIAEGVMAHAVPAMIHATGFSIGGRHATFEISMMPLRSKEGNCSRLLGSFVATTQSSWLGADPISLLVFGRSSLLARPVLKRHPVDTAHIDVPPALRTVLQMS